MKRLVGAAAALGLVALVWSSPPGVENDSWWSVQLHVHGSFSEGVGSIDSHSWEASRLGVDAIWWSDHDYRIASYRHVATFGFEGWSEPIDRGEEWSAWSERELEFEKSLVPIDEPLGNPALPGASGEFVRRRGGAGEHCLRVQGMAEGPDFARRVYAFHANRAFHQRPLAARVTVHVDVRPESMGPDGTALIEIGLSEHAPRSGDEPELWSLRYLLVQEPAEPYFEGAALCVPVVARPGKWNRLELPVTRDAIAGFERFPGDDNSLKWIAFGVHSRNGRPVEARFDDLRIEQELRGVATFARQRELLGEFRELYPDVSQLQGVEISYLGAHLNAYGTSPTLVDVDEIVRDEALLSGDPPRLDTGELAEAYLRRAVRESAGDADGLISLNHAFGASQPGAEARRPREKVLERLLDLDLYGAQLLEVGYRDRGGRDLEDHLWLWDQLALNGHTPVGIGVSDSHGGPEGRWDSAPNNFVSWIHAPDTTQRSMLEGLRAGRVVFGDIVHFDGALELSTPGGFRAGQLILTDREEHAFQAHVWGLEVGDLVHVVQNGERTSSHTAEGATILVPGTIRPDPERGAFVRIEVHDPEGSAMAFSNPLHFLRRVPEGGLPTARAALDLGGIRSRELAVEILDLAPRDGALVLRCRSRDGSMLLDVSCAGEVEVTLEDLQGEVRREAGLLELRGLSGEGNVVLRSAP